MKVDWNVYRWEERKREACVVEKKNKNDISSRTINLAEEIKANATLDKDLE